GGTGMLMSYTINGSTVVDPPDVEGVPDSILSIDVTGVEHRDLEADADNTVLAEILGPGAVMTGIGWDVTITTQGDSWLSESVVYFDGSDQDLAGLFLAPGVGEEFSGTGIYSSGGIIDLSDNAIPNIPVLADETLYLQFFESFDDNVSAADSVYGPTSTYDIAGIGIIGSLSGDALPVPTLSTIGLIALLTSLVGVGIFLLRR
ncbi:MAG: hypothetical protein MPN21_26295, partial [Thermoanaerobaculia bacterium]|nr:hypothetical protein [Thermoanaerobaculia bacterium]